MAEYCDVFDGVCPPKDNKIYINNKGAVVMSVPALICIMEHPEVGAKVMEKLVRGFVGETENDDDGQGKGEKI